MSGELKTFRNILNEMNSRATQRSIIDSKTKNCFIFAVFQFSFRLPWNGYPPKNGFILIEFVPEKSIIAYDFFIFTILILLVKFESVVSQINKKNYANCPLEDHLITIFHQFIDSIRINPFIIIFSLKTQSWTICRNS